jgi:hypothetical protein
MSKMVIVILIHHLHTPLDRVRAHGFFETSCLIEFKYFYVFVRTRGGVVVWAVCYKPKRRGSSSHEVIELDYFT